MLLELLSACTGFSAFVTGKLPFRVALTFKSAESYVQGLAAAGADECLLENQFQMSVEMFVLEKSLTTEKTLRSFLGQLDFCHRIHLVVS